MENRHPFEYELPWLDDKMQDKEYATNVYRALCNTAWVATCAPKNWRKIMNNATKKYYFQLDRWYKQIPWHIMMLVRKIALKYATFNTNKNNWWNKLADTINYKLCNLQSTIRFAGVGPYPSFDWYFSCTWRHAGGLVADIRNVGENYMDFYCSGGESEITDEIREDFLKIGWVQDKEAYDDLE